MRGYIIFIISSGHRQMYKVWSVGDIGDVKSEPDAMQSIKQLCAIIFKRLLLHLIIKRLKELTVHDPVKIPYPWCGVPLVPTMSPLSGGRVSFPDACYHVRLPIFSLTPYHRNKHSLYTIFPFHTRSPDGKAGGSILGQYNVRIQIGYKAGSRGKLIWFLPRNKYRVFSPSIWDSVNRLRLYAGKGKRTGCRNLL